MTDIVAGRFESADRADTAATQLRGQHAYAADRIGVFVISQVRTGKTIDDNSADAGGLGDGAATGAVLGAATAGTAPALPGAADAVGLAAAGVGAYAGSRSGAMKAANPAGASLAQPPRQSKVMVAVLVAG
jgi:hypothetical protein